jgi:hypothetical protein
MGTMTLLTRMVNMIAENWSKIALRVTWGFQSS